MNFIQQVYKGKNAWWHWAIILFISFSPYFYNVFEYLFFYKKQLNNFFQEGTYIGNKANFLIFKSFLFYAPFLAIICLGVKYLHRRSILSILNTEKSIRFKRIFSSFIAFIVIVTINILIDYSIHPEKFVFQYKKDTFWELLIVIFLFSPIKVFFQETFFRGYLLQGLATILKSKWLAVLFVAVIFGGIFSLNASTDYLEYNLLVFYIVTDIFLGIIVLLDDGNELTIGIGWANNVMAYVLVTHNWMPFKTDALFLDITNEPNYFFLVYFPIFVVYPLGILCYNYLYKWENWKEKLFGRVEKIKEL